MFSRTRASVAAEQSRLRDNGSDSGADLCREALAAGTETAAARKRELLALRTLRIGRTSEKNSSRSGRLDGSSWTGFPVGRGGLIAFLRARGGAAERRLTPFIKTV